MLLSPNMLSNSKIIQVVVSTNKRKVNLLNHDINTLLESRQYKPMLLVITAYFHLT